MLRHRAAGLHDLPGVYRVCLLTGEPPEAVADPERNPDLLGHVYAGPYLVHERQLARVVVDDRGVAGYLFGCRDTRDLDARLERDWWPALRAQYPLDGGSPGDRAKIALFHEPPHSPDSVVADFPSHLHIDLLPRLQGTGLGRELIDWLLTELTGLGSPGVHLGVGTENRNAIGFYEHLGFSRLEGDDDTTWMGMRLPAAST